MHQPKPTPAIFWAVATWNESVWDLIKFASRCTVTAVFYSTPPPLYQHLARSLLWFHGSVSFFFPLFLKFHDLKGPQILSGPLTAICELNALSSLLSYEQNRSRRSLRTANRFLAASVS